MDILQYIMDGEPPMTIEQARQDEEDLRYYLADLLLNPEKYMSEDTNGCPIDPADLEGCDSCQ